MYTIEEMSEVAAKFISTWKYEAPYEMYSFSDSKDEIAELQNGLHFAVYDREMGDCFEANPCGFLAIGWSAQIQDPKLSDIYEDESYTDIAFGLHPELCGKGMGEAFISELISFARNLFEEEGIRLTVDIENKRALSLYEKMGFKECFAFETDCVDVARGKILKMKIMIL